MELPSAKTVAEATEKVEYNKLTIFPTVGNGLINISGPLADIKNANIFVTDLAGRQVYSTSNRGKTNVIHLNLQPLQKGIYYLTIQQANEQITKEIIINR